MECTEGVMHGGKCSCKKLCPVSFGLAIGITFGLAVLIWSIWVIWFGPTTMMTQYHVAVPTFGHGVILALWALLKGFIFGFFVALFYDLIACCCKIKWCCK